MKKMIVAVDKFRDERDWRQFHTAKDLALSVSLEASELLENFQWLTSEEAIKRNSGNIKDEMADVLIYTLMLASDLNIDVEEIIQAKLVKNAEKYPVLKSCGDKESIIKKY